MAVEFKRATTRASTHRTDGEHARYPRGPALSAAVTTQGAAPGESRPGPGDVRQGLRDAAASIERGDAPRALPRRPVLQPLREGDRERGHYERCFAQWRDAMLGLTARPLPAAGAAPGCYARLRVPTPPVLGIPRCCCLLEKRDRAAMQPRLYSLFGPERGVRRARGGRRGSVGGLAEVAWRAARWLRSAWR